MKLISVVDAVELYGKSKDTLYSTACQIKSKNGKYPKWYIEKNGRSYIDVDEFERPSDLEREVWRYVTDIDGLYQLVLTNYGISDSFQSEYLAEKSHCFKSAKSWRSFLSVALFSLPVETRLFYKYTMTIDYLRIYSRWVYEQIKKERQNEQVA